jgi:hypothetical protein
MTTQDLSRHLFQPEKHYASARMQQGRPILDSDFNEAEILDDEGQRVVMVDVVGPHGSSTPGFTIGEVSTDIYDFEILAGSYFLGGMRHEIADVDGDPQRFREQTDWLQAPRPGVAPTLPMAPRHDLVYLVGWEQTVSAVEDLELVEHALGGRDTTVRVRHMHRVLVREATAEDCSAAFDGLVAALRNSEAHTFDPRSNELRSGARLTVGLATIESSDDLCSEPGVTGYVGGENQAIRVQMIATNRFLWAYDNASPLFRVTASRVGGTATIVFVTPPQEQALFALKEQIVELLPWGAVLPNGEHVADHPISDSVGGGLYARVLTSYNPVTKTLTATVTNTTLFDAMLTWFDDHDVDGDQRIFFLRVWNGDDMPMMGHGYSTAGTVALPGTGLEVTITSPAIVGDYWILAARPATPEQVIPWDLMDGAAPHGPRRFYCPLGMLHWSLDGDDLQVTADSCRRPFRPLTRLRGCCSVTVGDGVTSFGDYTSIQAAIDALPRDVPGKVCILPGIYEEQIAINNRLHGLVIEGCGPRTCIRTPPGNATSTGLISMVWSVDVTLRDFKLEATGQFGITMRGELLAPITWCQRISLDKLDVTTRRDPLLPAPALDELAVPAGSAAFPLSCVVGLGTLRTKILGCTFTQVGDLSAAANVLFALSTGLTIRNCKILSPPGEGATISKAWAGLHIAGGCSDVLIERCRIEGGLGHGITLGGAHRENATVDPEEPYDPGGTVVMAPTDDCPSVLGGFDVTGIPGRDDPPTYIPDDGPHDVRIRRNQIRAMGSSGISVLGFWPETATRSLEQIRTRDILIADNIIEQNCNHMPEDSLPPELREVAAFGGIVLADADGLRIHDNLIRSNGRDHRHPVCGIYVLHGENIVVENNQIQDNGRRVEGTALAGHRAGIALQLVGRPLFTFRDHDTPLDLSQPAARVRGNTVLQPAGRALQLYGLGPMFVEGNILVSEGQDGLDSLQRQYAVHCVEIRNLGQSPELAQTGTIPADIAIFPAPPLVLDPLITSDELLDGRILFTDNIVRFNPVSGAAEDIFCINLFQSYGDVSVLNNQFFALLPEDEGFILNDTIVVAWSTRTSHNRWEDPIGETLAGAFNPTNTSASTLAYMNITTLNQASRCIHVDTATGGPTHIAENQIFDSTGCALVPMLTELLAP